MPTIYNLDSGIAAMCPLTRKPCKEECMWMRPTAFNEPKCSMLVIADELVNIYSETRRGGGSHDEHRL